MNPPGERFSSHAATVLTLIGVAVGLGNVWRFPYMMGSHGGSAFLCIYLLFVVLFGFPSLMAEIALGRRTRSGPIGAFQAAWGKSAGGAIGGLLTAGLLVANAYYTVVIGQVLYASWFSLAHGFRAGNLQAVQSGLANGWIISAFGLVTLAGGLLVIALGLRRGIERVSKAFVPLFGVVVLYLIISSLALEGAPQKFAEFLRPDFSALTGRNVFAALGQAFFSLGLGGTFFVIYGSYMQSNEPIVSTAIWTGVGDTAAALMAALFIVPCALVFALDLQQGPKLVFETLPQLFSQLPGGRLVGTFFLLALSLVAFLSSLAALEVIVRGCSQSFGFKLGWLILAVGSVDALLIVVTSFHQQLIGPLDLIFGSAMQCLGSMFALLAMSWGLGRLATRMEIFGEASSWRSATLLGWLRWVVPGGIIVALVAASDLGQLVVGRIVSGLGL